MAATQEQTAGIEQINQAIAQMDQVTQQNASLVEEAAAASEAMQDQAAALAQTVSVFKVNAVQVAGSAPTVRPQVQANAIAKPSARRPSKAAVVNRAGEPKRIAHALPADDGDWQRL
jgi:methyl-accepting chemotaxis protein